MKYIKPSIKLNDCFANDQIAAFEGADMKISGVELDFVGGDNEAW